MIDQPLPCPFCGQPAQKMDKHLPWVGYSCMDRDCAAYMANLPLEKWNRRCQPLFQPVVWQRVAPVFYVHRSLKATLSSAGYLNLVVSENSIAGNLAAIKTALQHIELNPEAAIEFSMEYYSLDDDDREFNLTVGRSCYAPELEQGTANQTARSLMVFVRRDFLRRLAINQITLDGPAGALKETEVA